jgi:hypothetical protein
VLALSLPSCGAVRESTEIEQPLLSADTRFALDQIVREIRAARDPVGRLDAPPTSAEEALAGLTAMSLGGDAEGTPSAVQHEGYWICSIAPLDRPYWGQRGHAVERTTGDVYAWSLW